MLDICIIGGGASGLTAAVCAAERYAGGEIRVLEKKEDPGKKLAATGNGKCNMTNTKCRGAEQTVKFFSSLGVLTRTDSQGRVYPYSNQAKDVVYALSRQLKTLGVKVETGNPVLELRQTKGGFEVVCQEETITAKKVLLATGGKAGPQFGTTGDGYVLARKLGHSVTRLAPVLTGIQTQGDFRQLKGIRAAAEVWLEKDGLRLAAEQGEVQFNEDGVSGICVMNLSRRIKLDDGESFAQGMRRYRIGLDFLPEMEQEEVKWLLWQRRDIPELTVSDLLLSILSRSLGERLIREAGEDPGEKARDLSPEQIEKIGALLKSWKLPIRGTKGWQHAQCTSGGVALGEVDGETMESRIVPGLYLSGEILDFDGPCGGYNLQFAWETGIKAGRAMAYDLSNTSDKAETR